MTKSGNCRICGKKIRGYFCRFHYNPKNRLKKGARCHISKIPKRNLSKKVDELSKVIKELKNVEEKKQ